MKVNHVIRYVAEDGSEFLDELAADRYAAQADIVAELLTHLTPNPKGCDFSNGDGYLQHDPEKLRYVWNGLLAHASEFLTPHAWFEESKDLKADSSWAARLIGDYGHKALSDAWYRMQCVNRETAKEYGQPYFALHPDEAKAGRLN